MTALAMPTAFTTIPSDDEQEFRDCWSKAELRKYLRWLKRTATVTNDDGEGDFDTQAHIDERITLCSEVLA